MIDVNGADAYFAAHTQGRVWFEFSADQRKSAIEQAKRKFARSYKPLDENEGAYDYTQKVRHDFAAYEQALFMLMRDAAPNGVVSDVPALDVNERAEPKRIHSTDGNEFSEQALAWLGVSGHVRTVLG